MGPDHMTSVPWYGIKEKMRMNAADVPEDQIFYHATKAHLALGDEGLEFIE